MKALEYREAAIGLGHQVFASYQLDDVANALAMSLLRGSISLC